MKRYSQSDKDTACSNSVSHSSGFLAAGAWRFQRFRCRLGHSVCTLAVFQALLFMACCGRGSLTLIAANNQASVRVIARDERPSGPLLVTQRERQIHLKLHQTDRRQCDA